VPLGQPPQDEQQLDVLIRPSVPGGDPARQPMRKMFEPGDDPKGWDRASLRLNSHPLHPVRRLSQTDFLLPRATSLAKLLGDSVIFGAALAGLFYFPLLMVRMVVPKSTTWIVATVAAIGAAGALLVLVSAWIAERNRDLY
jgi:hypothetical protein